MQELLTMLESKYKRLEYIQSNGTQYIDLGLTANQDITIKCRVSNVNSGTQPFIGLSDANNLIYGIGQQSDGNYLFGQYYKTMTNNGRIVSDIVGNDGIVRNFELRKNEFYIDNILIGSITYHTFTTQNTIKLFTLNPSSSKASIEMYNAQVLDSNMNLLRNMIPVLRKSDNEIGMLDTVEGKFYPNAGTGKFTANLDTMYAIIQGTPTVQDGRVSGFSDSNYLKKVLNISNITEYEFQLKFTTGNTVTREQWLQVGLLSWGIYTDGKIIVYYSGGRNKRTQNAIQPNTEYTMKVTYKNNTHSLYLNGTLEFSISTAAPSITILRFGSIGNASYFLGTIDLNRSYIKIDDTKYKLQAVVGYTKVGTPTIVDNVASGFTLSDYLKTSIVILETKNFEFKTSFVANSIQATRLITTYGSSVTFDGIYIQNSGRIAFKVYDGTTSHIVLSNIQYLTNTKYYVIGYRKGNKIGIKISTNDVDWTENTADIPEGTIITNSSEIDIGINRSGATFLDGSIDLNETYIKINNKLWFNGLPQ